jgi:hypothetical protein
MARWLSWAAFRPRRRRSRTGVRLPLDAVMRGLEAAFRASRAEAMRRGDVLASRPPPPLAAALAQAGLDPVCGIGETVCIAEECELSFRASIDPRSLEAARAGAELILFVPEPRPRSSGMARRAGRWLRPPGPPPRNIAIRLRGDLSASLTIDGLPFTREQGDDQ